VRYSLVWRDEIPSPALRELIASARAGSTAPAERVLEQVA
jgi:hypothetical protein